MIALHVRIYTGVKTWIWLQALTLVHILPRQGELRHDFIKAIKDVSTSKKKKKKTSKEKEGPVRCLWLYSQELKPWKSLILWIEQDCENQLHKNCYS